jgi:tetratricopeptide (TPR) repeat protein
MRTPAALRSFTGTLAISAALFAAPAAVMGQTPDAHAQHGAAPDQVGSASVQFETSCAAAVRDDFNRAVAMLHSFWFPEAIKAFEDVARRDPSCAMAHWGVAMSQWGNPYGGIKGADLIQRGQATVGRARTTGNPTPRERALIDAVAILYSATDPGSHRDRVLKYEAAMQRVAADYPNDVELRIYHALAVTQSALPTDKTYAKQLEAARILEPLFAKMPTHPGLAHYVIHAYDAPPLAEKGLVAARRYASLAPAVPHALHMPSHTFTRLGFWQESIDTNRRSADAARSTNDAGSELHALDYQTYAYLQLGQDVAAKGALDRATAIQNGPGANTFAVAAIPARYALERGDWAAAAALTVRPAAATPYTEAITHFARALGAARAGQPAAATPDIARLAELRDRLTAIKDEYWSEQVDIQRRIALAWQVFAQGRKDEGLAQMRAAADAEDATDKAAVTPGPLAPARELLGYMLLEAGLAREALVAFEATMKKEPNRLRGTYGAARAAQALGDNAKARTYYSQLLQTTQTADTSRPELVAARSFVGQ